MSLLELIPVPVEAKSYVVALLPVIALALAVVITKLLVKESAS